MLYSFSVLVQRRCISKYVVYGEHLQTFEAGVQTVKFYDFEIVIEKEPEDAGYFAYSPSLPGCFSNGLTIEETGSISARPSNSTSACCKRMTSPYHNMSDLCTSKP